MGKSSKVLVTLTTLFLFSGQTYAAASGPRQSGLGYYFSIGAGASYGTLAATDLNLSSRNMAVYGINSDLGIELGSFMIGAGVEYNMWKQIKSPSDLDGTNAQGTELSFGPAIGYNFGKFILLGRYYLSSKYSLEKEDASGNKVSLSKPKSSFAVEARIPFGSGRPYLGLEYKAMKYSSVDVGGTTSDIPSGSEMTTSSFGASVGLMF